MDTIIIVILVIIAIAAALVAFYIITYNKIQKNIVRIEEAESEIDDTLRRRYDLLEEMEKVINENTEVKQDNFKEFKKDSKFSNFDLDRQLTKIADTFSKIKADYRDELDIETYRNLLVDLKMEEEKCTAAKTYYNKYTTELNMLIGKFPSNIIARIHKIETRLYFDNKDMKDDDILDFKL